MNLNALWFVLVLRYLLLCSCFSLSSYSAYAVNEAAGVFAIFDDGTTLMGKEQRNGKYVYTDHGGMKDPTDPSFATAARREFMEETGRFSFNGLTDDDVENSPYVETFFPRTQLTYRMYLVHIHGQKPPIEDISNNAAWAKHKLGAANAHVEKVDWRYVNIQELLNTAQNDANLEGTNEKIFHPLRINLIKPTAYVQNITRPLVSLKTFLESIQNQPILPIATQNLVISYSLNPLKRRALFDKVVNNHISGKTAPDHYHVTLGWIKNVEQSDCNLLQDHLQKIANAHLPQTTFTASSVKKYLVNRKPDSCPLVLVPQPTEIQKLKSINEALFNGLQVYNATHKKNYTFFKDVHPQQYDPHITLANTNHIITMNLKYDQIINHINTTINKSPLELLKAVVPPTVVPSAKEEGEKEEKELALSKALNPGFNMDENATLPKGWSLIDAAKNRDISKPISLKKKPIGVELLGDNYTFYTNVPALKNFDNTTFTFNATVRSTNPGVCIQYYDGKNAVTSNPYASKKGEWETLNIEFNVDGKAKFHRLYSAILGAVKGNPNSSVDIRNIKLQRK
jgi:8-oxo-dGTP pyrophosphatase MutT (NUDIX family)/2'-5' RNA ligase